MSEAAVYLSAKDLRAELARQVDMAGTQAEWARLHSVPRSQVCDTLAGRRDVSAGVLAGMGLMKVERFIVVRRGANA